MTKTGQEKVEKTERRKYDTVFEYELKSIGERLDNLLEYNERQDETTQTIKKMMTGNGEPEKGVITRIIVAENNIKTIFKKFTGLSKLHYAIGVSVIIAIIKIAFF